MGVGFEVTGDGAVRFGVKVVPGASQTEIVGAYGQRLKVRISAPPEDGKANRAVAEVIATALGVKVNAVKIVAGLANAQKVVEVRGLNAGDISKRLGV